MEELQVIIIINNNNNKVMDLFLSTPWSVGLLAPVSMVLCWRNMTREYSSPYKVGLINVGTKFAQSRLVWFEIAYGKLNFHGTVILARRFSA